MFPLQSGEYPSLQSRRGHAALYRVICGGEIRNASFTIFSNEALSR
jgi:hypothetical protein